MISLLAKNYTRLAAVALALGVVGLANAGEVHITGSTKGQFDAQAFGTTNNLLGLVYSGSTFDNTTVANTLDLGGDPVPDSTLIISVR